jgi:cobalamin biosynthesis protein CobD/CbiB
LALLALMRFGPDIPLTRMLNEQLVARPLRWLDKRQRHDLLFAVILLGLAIGGGEMILIFGPEFAMVYAADVALYLDALFISYLMTTQLKVKAALRAVHAFAASQGHRVLRRFRATPREVVSRKPASDRSDNDNEGDSPVLSKAA